MQERRNRLLRHGTLLLLAGLLYAALCFVTGWALPCPFHLVTGLLCPGCGITRACLSLLSGDIAAAWGYNQGLLAALPLLILLAVRLIRRYLVTGCTAPEGWEKRLVWGMIVYLLLWGVLRNLL